LIPFSLLVLATEVPFMPEVTTSRTYGRRWRYGTQYDSGSDTVEPYDDKETWSDTRDGIENPLHWKWRIKHHYGASTPMTAKRIELEVSDTSASYVWGTGTNENVTLLDGKPFSVVFPTSGSIASAAEANSARQSASIGLLAEFRDAQTKLQTLVAAGEFGQTLRMLRNPAKALFEGIHDYFGTVRKRSKRSLRSRRRRRKDADKDMLRDTWLEAQFGWRPLIGDIEGAYEALTNMPTSRYRYCKSGATRESATFSVSGGYFGNMYFPSETRTKTIAEARAYGQVSVDMTTPNGHLARWGVRTADFLPTVWELIPYSFVADYFSNIGKVIAAGSFPTKDIAWSGCTTRRSCVKVVKRYFSEAGTKSAVGSTFKSGSGSGGGYTATRRQIDRYTTGIVSVGLSSIRFEIPGLGLKWLNMAALVSAGRRTSRGIS
jgi:hypothetical protein